MKVLLITHNPVSTDNNMGKTFLSLFSRFDESELCQIYVYNTYPNAKVCHSYFRITDREVLKSLYTFRAPGQEVQCSDAEATCDSKAPAIKNKNGAVQRLIRDFVWKLSPWYSPKLKKWIEKEKPTHIFLAPGYAKFIYDIALKISKDYQLPIITYICDEYYFVSRPASLAERFRLSLLKKKMEVLMKKTSSLVAICDEIKVKYSEHFQVPATTIMTGADALPLQSENAKGTPNSISYFGNLGCNRFLSLCDVGRALESINRRQGTSFTLKIYTNEKDSKILEMLSEISTISLCGFITGDAFQRAVSNSDFLLHVEAFDQESIDLVKHSVSTKIADSLASGIPLLAYGPNTVSSMKHLMRHDCALISTSKESLESMIETAFFQSEERERVVRNALQTATEYHDKQKNSADLRSVFAAIKEEHS